MRKSKPCNTCGIVRPLADFSLDGRLKDGHINKCKTCMKEYKRAYERDNRDRINATKRRWRSTPEGYARQKAGNDRSRLKYPERARAWVQIHRAIKAGKIERKTCQRCKAAPGEAHPRDVSRPLVNITWLCRTCYYARKRARRAREERAS